MTAWKRQKRKFGGGHLSAVHVSIFVDMEHVHIFEKMRRAILDVFPHAQIIGAVSRAGVINGTLIIRKIMLNFTLFESSKVRVMAFDFCRMSSRQAGKELLTILQADQNVRAVGIISTGFHLDINPFFHEVSKSRRNIVFFGGLADAESNL